jgi:hypothetical protein
MELGSARGPKSVATGRLISTSGQTDVPETDFRTGGGFCENHT